MIAYFCVVAVVVGLVWWLLRKDPSMLTGVETAKIENGMCPEPLCSGETYQVACDANSVLWRCPECKQTWLLVKVPDARPRD